MHAARLGPLRLPGRRRARRPAPGPPGGGPPPLAPAGSRGRSGPGDPPRFDPGELLWVAPADVRVPFEVREVLARVLDGSRFEEFKPLYGSQLVCGWGELAGLPARRPCQQRDPLLRGGAQGRPVHRPVQPLGHPAPLRAEHHRLHGGHPLRAGWDHQGRGEADQRRLQLDRAPPHLDGGRQLRGGQLRHGRPGLRPALRLHLAQPQDRRDGTQAAGRGALHRPAQRRRRGRPAVRRGRRRGAAPGHRGPDRARVHGAVRHRPALGRRGHRPAGTPARCSRSPWRPPTRRRSEGTAVFGVVRH